MSRRRSTGDLVPRDISEILAREARAQRGQKKPGGSFGQALSWLKGSRRKKTLGNGLNRTGTGVTEVKVGLQNLEPAKGWWDSTLQPLVAPKTVMFGICHRRLPACAVTSKDTGATAVGEADL